MLKPEHIPFIFIKQPKTDLILVTEILLANLQLTHLELIIVGFLISLFLDIQEYRIATQVAFVPQGEGLLLLNVGFFILEIHNDLLAR